VLVEVVSTMMTWPPLGQVRDAQTTV